MEGGPVENQGQRSQTEYEWIEICCWTDENNISCSVVGPNAYRQDIEVHAALMRAAHELAKAASSQSLEKFRKVVEKIPTIS